MRCHATPFVCCQMTGAQKRPVRVWTEAFRARNNRLLLTRKRKLASILRRSERLFTTVRMSIYSGWLYFVRPPILRS